MANFNKEFWDKQMNDNVIKGPWKPRKENDENRKKVLEDRSFIAVSYTHLTLPTKA